MSRVRIETGTGRAALEISGHAVGSNDACCMISALVCSLAGWCDANPDKCRTERREIDLDRGGYALFILRGGKELQGAFGLVEQGLRQIANQWPEAVQICAGALGEKEKKA